MDKTMYAVVKTGGKQYKVAKDDIIEVEKLDGARVSPALSFRAGNQLTSPHPS